VNRLLAENDLQAAAPIFGETDSGDVNFRHEIFLQRLRGGTETQAGRDEPDQRRLRINRATPAKYPLR